MLILYANVVHFAEEGVKQVEDLQRHLQKRAEEILEKQIKPMLGDFRLSINVYERKYGDGNKMKFHVWLPGSFEALMICCTEDDQGNLTWFAGNQQIETTLPERIKMWLRYLQERHESVVEEIKDRLW